MRVRNVSGKLTEPEAQFNQMISKKRNFIITDWGYSYRSHLYFDGPDVLFRFSGIVI